MYSTHGTAFAIDDRHYWRDVGCGVSDSNRKGKWSVLLGRRVERLSNLSAEIVPLIHPKV